MRTTYRIATVVVSTLAAGILALADGPPPGWEPSPAPKAQVALVIVSPFYHPEELNALLDLLREKGAGVSVTVPSSPGTVLLLQQAIRPDLLQGREGEIPVHIVDFGDAAQNLGFHKLILAGAGWYQEFFQYNPQTKTEEPKQPPYADKLFQSIRQAVKTSKTIGAYGSGLYPLVLSGALPKYTRFASYPCETLVKVAQSAGLEPQVPSKMSYDSKGRPVPPSWCYFSCGSWRLITASVPNGWYGPGEGPLLMGRYGEALREFVELLEDAFYAPTTLTPGQIATIDPSGGPFSVTPPQPVRIMPANVNITAQGGTVGFRNEGAVDVNLTGWKVQSVDPKTDVVISTFNFPEGFVLKAGATVTLHTGPWASPRPPTELLWTRGKVFDPIAWEVRLIDLDGQLRLRFYYR